MTDSNTLEGLLDAPLTDARPEPQVETPAPEAPPEPTPETVEVEAAPTDPGTGEDKATEAASDTPPVSEPAKPEPPSMVPSQALGEARNRYRRAENQLRDLQQKVAALEGQHNPPPDMLEDPEGYQAHQSQQLSGALFNERANISTALIVGEHGEDAYREAEDIFAAAVEQNPVLRTELANHPLPAHFVWQHAQNVKAQAEIGDPQTYRERVRAEVKAEMQGNMAELVQQQVQEALASKLPSSLATEQAAGTRTSEPTWTGPKPIGSLIPE